MSAWTGGQWSLVRALLGAYLVVHFAALLPYAAEVFSDEGVLADGGASPLLALFPNVLLVADGPVAVTALVALGAVASLGVALGWRDRVAAVVAWYVLACLFGRNPLIANPSLPYVGLLLLVHAGVPRAPYGSLEARGRTDPGGGWRLPPELTRVLWILMSLGYTYSGWTKLASPSWRDGSALERVLENPLARPGPLREALLELPGVLLSLATWGVLALELGFALAALAPRLRPWIWTAMLALHLGLIGLIDFADLSLGMVLLHLATFDPRWVRPRRDAERPTLFYDGTCGLCHSTVRFVLAEDTDAHVRLAPLQGATFADEVPAERRAELPDSVVLRRHDGTLLVRTRAIVALLRSLGGLWGVVGALLALVPSALANVVYDAVARSRRALWARPADLCPLLPPALAERFRP